MKHLLLAMLALAAAPLAHAQPESAYYGVSLGTFDYDEGIGFDRIDDTASSYRLLVGYQFMKHLGVEGGYGKTGTLRDTASVPVFPAGTIDLNFNYSFKILTVRLLGVLPFDNGVSLLGGLGYSDMKVDFGISDGVDSFSNDESTNEPGYYLGAQYNWDRFAIRVGYEKFDFDGDVDVRETMLSFFYKL